MNQQASSYLPFSIQMSNQHSQPLPFYQLGYNFPQQMTVQQFISYWIEQIIFGNRKIQTQAKAEIASLIAKFNLFQLSSCSSVYQLIRSKIEQIMLIIRDFIAMSFKTLDKQRKNLSNILQPHKKSFSEAKNDPQKVDQISLTYVHLPIAKMFLQFYTHICAVMKEVCSYCKILFHSFQVQDFEISTFQNFISNFVLEMFMAPFKTFTPQSILSSLSLENKCKFICADSQGIDKRLVLSTFDQNELKKFLTQKKSKQNQILGTFSKKCNLHQSQIMQYIKGHFQERKEGKKNQQEKEIVKNFNQLVLYHTKELKSQEIKTKNQQILENQKYEDFDGKQSNKIDSQTLELFTTFQSQSESIAQQKNATPSEHKKDQITAEQKREQIEAINEKSQIQAKAQQVKQQAKAKINDFPQTKEKIQQLKTNEKAVKAQDSNKCLQEGRQTLQKYFYDLQKQKIQLRKEIQKLMKDNEKEINFFKQATNSLSNKGSSRLKYTCQCVPSLRKFSLRPYNCTHYHQLHMNCKQAEKVQNQVKQEKFEEKKQKNLFGDYINTQLEQIEEKQETFLEQSNQKNVLFGRNRQKNKKSNSKKQKLQIRLRNTSLNFKDNKQEQVSEDQAQLMKIMDSLRINTNLRANCHIDEKRLQRWKDNILKIQNNQMSFKKAFTHQKVLLEQVQKKSEKRKKKQKR